MHAGRISDFASHIKQLGHTLVFDVFFVPQGSQNLGGKLWIMCRGIDDHGHIYIIDKVCHKFGNCCVWIQQVSYQTNKIKQKIKEISIQKAEILVYLLFFRTFLILCKYLIPWFCCFVSNKENVKLWAKNPWLYYQIIHNCQKIIARL